VDRQPAAIPRYRGYGNHEYGNRVGIFRILAVLDKYGIKPTLALDKAVADHYPFLVEEGQKRGAEFIAARAPSPAHHSCRHV
jgi:peptidoglycan/xylan/chitin deacetylase (PgdA/CDA1 family)